MLSVGTTVEIKISKRNIDLVKLFDGLLDEETMNAIFDKFHEAKKVNLVKSSDKTSVGLSPKGRPAGSGNGSRFRQAGRQMC